VALLAQVLQNRPRREAGAGEALEIEDGKVTEGGSSSAFILTQDDVLVTRQNGSEICRMHPQGSGGAGPKNASSASRSGRSDRGGVAAKEAFITSATVFVQAVVTIDGKTVANGKPGPMTDRCARSIVDFAKATAV